MTAPNFYLAGDWKVIKYKENFNSIYLEVDVMVVADCFQWESVSCRMLR